VLGFTLVLVMLVGPAVFVAGVLQVLLGDLSTGVPPGPTAISSIPPEYLALYEEAATTCPGLAWTVLAAIGTVESDNGQSTLPGVHSGHNPAGAEGPMQFEPATFAEYATIGPGGQVPPSPYDPVDAIYTAAKMLCANGAGSQALLRNALFAYNHSWSYVNEVLALAATYGVGASGPVTRQAIAETALSFAIDQLGKPYKWGGTGPAAFDCSGLAEAAYAAAGVSLPRTAQQQYDTGPLVGPGQKIAPGDLVFFGASGSQISHVGIYAGGGEMIDAPHTGASVRLESYRWGDYVGATDPAAGPAS
jgi:cell wall-associated NlpC family hydrolase